MAFLASLCLISCILLGCLQHCTCIPPENTRYEDHYGRVNAAPVYPGHSISTKHIKNLGNLYDLYSEQTNIQFDTSPRTLLAEQLIKPFEDLPMQRVNGMHGRNMSTPETEFEVYGIFNVAVLRVAGFLIKLLIGLPLTIIEIAILDHNCVYIGSGPAGRSKEHLITASMIVNRKAPLSSRSDLVLTSQAMHIAQMDWSDSPPTHEVGIIIFGRFKTLEAALRVERALIKGNFGRLHNKVMPAEPKAKIAPELHSRLFGDAQDSFLDHYFFERALRNSAQCLTIYKLHDVPAPTPWLSLTSKARIFSKSGICQLHLDLHSIYKTVNGEEELEETKSQQICVPFFAVDYWVERPADFAMIANLYDARAAAITIFNPAFAVAKRTYLDPALNSLRNTRNVGQRLSKIVKWTHQKLFIALLKSDLSKPCSKYSLHTDGMSIFSSVETQITSALYLQSEDVLTHPRELRSRLEQPIALLNMPADFATRIRIDTPQYEEHHQVSEPEEEEFDEDDYEEDKDEEEKNAEEENREEEDEAEPMEEDPADDDGSLGFCEA